MVSLTVNGTSYAFFVLDIARLGVYNELDRIMKGGNIMKKIYGFYELDKIVKNQSAISRIHPKMYLVKDKKRV